MKRKGSSIVVLDGYTVNPGDCSWESIAELGEFAVHDRSSETEIVDRAKDARVVITNKVQLDAATLRRLPNLEGICVLATGHDVVDGAAARARNIPVCNAPGYSTPSVVEHTFALLFELSRGVGVHDVAVRHGEWSRCPDFSFTKTPQRELAGLTLGVVGYGSIGRRVGRVGRALGMRVLATVSRPRDLTPDAENVSLEELFEGSDIVTLHCPLTPETEGLVRWELLSRMKRSALLLNTARGALIREADLARALSEGLIAGAALDVLRSEPPEPSNPLLGAPHCIVTPHMAWHTLESRKRLIGITRDNVKGILEGRPTNVVN